MNDLDILLEPVGHCIDKLREDLSNNRKSQKETRRLFNLRRKDLMAELVAGLIDCKWTNIDSANAKMLRAVKAKTYIKRGVRDKLYACKVQP